MRRLLEQSQVVMHPFLVAELALGPLHHRPATLAKLDEMPQLRAVDRRDVRQMIEAHGLHGQGIGLTDAHLIAACLATPGTLLWTLDARLGEAAEALGVRAEVACGGSRTWGRRRSPG